MTRRRPSTTPERAAELRAAEVAARATALERVDDLPVDRLHLPPADTIGHALDRAIRENA